ncbi:LysE family transporter [Leptolyngbya sp. NK1-12]|uniref:LysE family transporter n=1 Tax=Leptolyngbya sp. NK1-12 TaxID=2547451 RepID=A0AA96WD42_9CYAN|nr:LysE family transporter [Leptolyngbya sp. NK1-12]
MTEWITVFVIASLVIISPGPNFFITLRNSLIHSRRAGVYTALGLSIADLIHMTYCLIGIGVVISQSILVFTLLKWLGAIYLVYIGIKSLRTKPQQASTLQPEVALNNRSAFRMGLFTCLLNPKATLFYLALFTQIIQPNTPLWVQILYGATVAGIEFGWFACVAITMSQPVIQRRFVSISHWLDRLMGAILIGLGLRLALIQKD